MRSAFWAGTHPCYDPFGGGYVCDCGHRSRKLEQHNVHVWESHSDDLEFCRRVLTWREYQKLAHSVPGGGAAS